MNPNPPKLTIRVGCHIVYETLNPTPIVLVLRPRRDDRQRVKQERFSLTPGPLSQEYKDAHGNLTHRAMLQPGQNVLHHDALVSVTSLSDSHYQRGFSLPVDQLPFDVLRYTLPSRYCDSDKLLAFSWQKFGWIIGGLEQVRAICDWTHENIQYRFGSGRSDISASDVIQRGYGVCRDFAHVAIALCRALNLPARYVTGLVPDVGWQDPGTPMDFHAYFEVYLNGNWCPFDARFNKSRTGRIKVAQGLDAVDGAFSTIYGEAAMTWFEVWSYQVNPDLVTLDDPVDFSKRLDGTRQVRFR